MSLIKHLEFLFSMQIISTHREFMDPESISLTEGYFKCNYNLVGQIFGTDKELILLLIRKMNFETSIICSILGKN